MGSFSHLFFFTIMHWPYQSDIQELVMDKRVDYRSCLTPLTLKKPVTYNWLFINDVINLVGGEDVKLRQLIRGQCQSSQMMTTLPKNVLYVVRLML